MPIKAELILRIEMAVMLVPYSHMYTFCVHYVKVYL